VGRQAGVSDHEALVAAVARALGSQSRRSVHPADHAALRRTASHVALALRKTFVVHTRHDLDAELTEHPELNAIEHE
jgi:DeoR/GlpR family transcriptional regulator of sugar metabolism